MKNTKFYWTVCLALLLGALTLSACDARSTTTLATPTAGMVHTGDMHDMDMDMSGMLIPANGATISIVSPADGSEFAVDSDIRVEVKVENFDLTVGHWHLNVDGAEYAMISGGDLSQVVRGLEVGEHKIEASLSNAEHQNLEGGAIITVIIK